MIRCYFRNHKVISTISAQRQNWFKYPCKLQVGQKYLIMVRSSFHSWSCSNIVTRKHLDFLPLLTEVFIFYAGRIKALLLQRNINYFGDAFGEMRLPQRFLLRRCNRRRHNRRIKSSGVVYLCIIFVSMQRKVAIKKRFLVIFFIAALFYCGTLGAVEEERRNQSAFLRSP